MNRPDTQSGFSIIDMIMGLSILAIAIVGIMSAQRNYVNMSSEIEVGIRGISLGNSVMQTIRMHRFDEEQTPTWSTSYGTDTGESSMSDYDDIDDFAAASWDYSDDGFAGFTISTRVFCVNLASSWLDSVGPGTNYKRIIVSINHDVLETPVVFSSLYAGVFEE